MELGIFKRAEEYEMKFKMDLNYNEKDGWKLQPKRPPLERRNATLTTEATSQPEPTVTSDAVSQSETSQTALTSDADSQSGSTETSQTTPISGADSQSVSTGTSQTELPAFSKENIKGYDLARVLKFKKGAYIVCRPFGAKGAPKGKKNDTNDDDYFQLKAFATDMNLKSIRDLKNNKQHLGLLEEFMELRVSMMHLRGPGFYLKVKSPQDLAKHITMSRMQGNFSLDTDIIIYIYQGWMWSGSDRSVSTNKKMNIF